MSSLHRIVIIGLLCGCGGLTHAAGGDWTTIYGSAREEARAGLQFLPGRAAFAGAVGGDRARAAGDVARDARAVPLAAAHAAGRHGHRRAGARGLRGREGPLPEHPRGLRDRQPLPSGQARGAAAGRAVPVRPHARER